MERKIKCSVVSFVMDEYDDIRYATYDNDIAREMAETVNSLMLKHAMGTIDSPMYGGFLTNFFREYLQLDDNALEFEYEHDCPIEELQALADKKYAEWEDVVMPAEDIEDFHADIAKIVEILEDNILHVFSCNIDADILYHLTESYPSYTEDIFGSAYPEGYVISFRKGDREYYLSDERVYCVDKDGSTKLCADHEPSNTLYLVYERGLTRNTVDDMWIKIHKLGKDGIRCCDIRSACEHDLDYSEHVGHDRAMLEFMEEHYSHISTIEDYYNSEYFDAMAVREADDYWEHEDEDTSYRYEYNEDGAEIDDDEDSDDSYVDEDVDLNAYFDENDYFATDNDDLVFKYKLEKINSEVKGLENH